MSTKHCIIQKGKLGAICSGGKVNITTSHLSDQGIKQVLDCRKVEDDSICMGYGLTVASNGLYLAVGHAADDCIPNGAIHVYKRKWWGLGKYHRIAIYMPLAGIKKIGRSVAISSTGKVMACYCEIEGSRNVLILSLTNTLFKVKQFIDIEKREIGSNVDLEFIENEKRLHITDNLSGRQHTVTVRV